MPRRLACLVILLSSLARAQELPKSFSVVVTDNKGNRVSTLQRDDFEAVTRSVKHAITAFSGTGSTAAMPRRIAVVFDVTSATLSTRSNSVDALRDFLGKSLRPGDRVVILTAGQTLTPLSPWTADRAEIESALQRARTSASQSLAGDRAAAEKRIRELINDIQQTPNTFQNFDTLLEAVRAYASVVYRDTRQSIGLLAAATDLFPARGSRNALVVIGAGLSARAGADLFQYLDTIKSQAERGQLGPALRGGAARSSPMSESSAFDLTPILHDFAMEARRKGVAIYALDPEMSESASSHVESVSMLDRNAAFSAVANRSDGYQMMADDTGGLAFLARRPSEALAEMQSDLDAFYSVTVQPSIPLTAKDSIQLRAKSGYKVRMTPGSAPLTPDDEVRGRVVAHHLLKPDTNDLGISLQAGEPVPDGEKRRVPLKVMIPIKNLKFEQNGDEVTGAFTVYITTGDRLGRASKVNKQTQQLRWPAAALSAAGDRQLTFAVDVVLEPGLNQISVGVLDDRSHATGYDRVSI